VTGADHGIDSPAAAIEALCAHISIVEAEEAPLDEAFGRALATPVVADRPSPAADVSAMDGYAVDTSVPGRRDAEGGSVYPVAFEVQIGQDPGELLPGACARIVTGAAIPRGADAVVRREDTEEAPDSIRIRAGVEVRPGANIRRRGENCAAGAAILEAGAEITAPVAAALAAFGAARVSVRRPLRLAILITGDELRPLGEPITEFQLRDSNGPTVAAMFAAARGAWIGAVERARAPDDPVAIRDALGAMLERADAAIITGGVSMGDHDHVPDVVRSLGAEVLFHKLPQRPGKPMLGALLEGRPILALPGNPVSVMVTARRIAMPVLRRLAGFAPDPAPPVVTLTNDDGKSLNLWWRRPVRLGGAGTGGANPSGATTSGAGLQPAGDGARGVGLASLITSKGSGDIPAAAGSDGFVEIPPGQGGAGPWAFFGWTR
jgi:molybdopterin molybdotransferase